MAQEKIKKRDKTKIDPAWQKLCEEYETELRSDKPDREKLKTLKNRKQEMVKNGQLYLWNPSGSVSESGQSKATGPGPSADPGSAS